VCLQSRGLLLQNYRRNRRLLVLIFMLEGLISSFSEDA
jgi:hypothetical protein